jgi:hypothetical protein
MNYKWGMTDLVFNPKGNVVKIADNLKYPELLSGEVYVSEVNNGEIKAWRLHKKLRVLLVLASGCVEIQIYDRTQMAVNKRYFLKERFKDSIYIEPGIWYGFKGANIGKSELLVICEGVHDEEEVLRLEYEGTWEP